LTYDGPTPPPAAVSDHVTGHDWVGRERGRRSDEHLGPRVLLPPQVVLTAAGCPDLTRRTKELHHGSKAAAGGVARQAVAAVLADVVVVVVVAAETEYVVTS